jgi:hypothetical protein
MIANTSNMLPSFEILKLNIPIMFENISIRLDGLLRKRKKFEHDMKRKNVSQMNQMTHVI